jgi:RNA polymerase sigma factor (sigma-70 family)
MGSVARFAANCGLAATSAGVRPASGTPHPPMTSARGKADAERLVVETVQRHAAALLRVARRYSICSDDAQDAYQRALEIFVRRADSLEADTVVPWLRTVVKHEALAVRAARHRLVGPVEADMDGHEAVHVPSPDERAASFERLTRSAEALQRLKPQELRALVLKAQGHSYREICELTGWTYTKVNRCLTEGRRSFLDRYAGIESGDECRRWAPVISAIADGEASADDLIAIRPHLRNCPGCRAAVRDLRATQPALGALVPATAAASAAGSAPGLLARLQEALVGMPDRLALSAHKWQAGVEAASTGKLAAVAASATAVAGGGIAAVDGSAPANRPAARPAAPPPAARASAPAHVARVPRRHDRLPASRDSIAAPPAPAAARAPRSAATPARRSGDFDFEGGGEPSATSGTDFDAAAEPASAAGSASGAAATAGSPEFGP